MKAIKISAIVIVIAIGLFAILGMVGPKDVEMSRSIEIDAPKSEVWAHVSTLEGQHQWSPWAKMDPDMTYEIKGEDGKVGAIYTWSGNSENVGSGSQTIASVDPMKRIQTDLKFTEPMESNSVAYVEVDGDKNSSTVTWGFSSEFDFVTSAFMNFMSLEAQLGPDYEKGLENLKEICEAK